MVLYASPREAGVDNVYRQRADGTGSIEPLTSGKNHVYPISIAPKGHEVVLVDGSDSIMTLAVLHLDGTNRITFAAPEFLSEPQRRGVTRRAMARVPVG